MSRIFLGIRPPDSPTCVLDKITAGNPLAEQFAASGIKIKGTDLF